MAKGRKPKPEYQKHLEGTYRPDRARPDVLPVDNIEGTPKPPSWMSPRAKKVFKQVAGRLQRLGVMYELHQESVAMYCDQVARYQEMAHFFKTNKYVEEYTTESGETMSRSRPETIIQDKAFNNALKLGARFGFTLADLAALRMEPKKASEDPYESGRDKGFMKAVS
jgi:P27 family predicted phage terminase small subunit